MILAQSDPRRRTREEVKRLTEAGLTALEIAQRLGVTRQRVYQQQQALRDAGELAEKAS
jgi:transposase